MRTFLLAGIICAFASTADASEWRYFEETNPLTGGKDFWAAIDASQETVGARYPRERMTLLVACMENQFDVSVYVGEYLGRGRLQVRYRFGENAAITEKWIASVDGTSVFLPRNYKDFLTALSTDDTVAFEAVDYRGVEYRTVFTGLSSKRDSFERVKSECVRN